MEIICQPYDVTVPKEPVLHDETGVPNVNIHLWCLDRENKPVLVRVRDFPAYCYIEFPNIVNGAHYDWDESSAGKVFDYLKKVLGENAPFEWVFGRFQKLYYFKGDIKYPMIFVKFRTLDALNHCNNLLKSARSIYPFGVIKLNVYEAHIDIIRKFYTTIDAKFSQWLRVVGDEFGPDNELRISTDGTKERPIREISVSYRNVFPVSEKESESWFTQPRILAFDIETYSDNHKAMPNSLTAKHVCNIISCIYYELGNKNSRKKYVIVLGDSKPQEDCEVIKVQTELELIHAFCKLIEKLDPEIISGYNIFAYDYPYLNNRLNNKMEDWPKISRIANKPIEMSKMEWKSGAYGTQSINILQMEGRLSIDMLPIIKRDYRLDKYDLDTVSNTFIGRGKLDVKPVDMFRAYERQAFIIKFAKQYILEKLGQNVTNWVINDKLKEIVERFPEEKSICEKIAHRYELALNEVTRIVSYCIQDSDLVVDLFDKLNVWIGLNALSSVVGVTIIQLFTRGQQVRCLSQVYDRATRKGIVLDKRVKDKVFYEGGFVFEPKPGLYTGVICLDFASLYPSIMRAYNICFTTLVPQECNDSISDEHAATIEVNQEEPINMSQTELDKLLKKQAKAIEEGGVAHAEIDDPEEGDDTEDVETKEPKTIMKVYKYKWVNKKVRYGILPEIQDHLVGSRNVIKKEIAALEDELEECSDPKRLAEIKMLLVLKDKYSNALKVSANSLYGFLGAQEGGVLSLIEAAMCITATGRNLINKVNRFVETKYGASVVYGDTDSSMVDMHVPIKEVFNRGLELAQEITYGLPEKVLEDGTIVPASPPLFPPPLKIEFEKAMKMCCFKKKKYAAFYIDKNGEYMREKNKDGTLGEYKILKRGIIVARRDTAKIVHKVYNKLLMMVLKEEPITDSFNLIINTVDDLINDRIPARGNLSIIRSYAGNYSSETYFMKIFGDELIRMGKPVNPSDRLEYVIVKTQEEDNYTKGKSYPVGLKLRLIDMYEDSQNLKDKDSEEVSEQVKAIKNDPTLVFETADDPLRVPDESTAMYPPEPIDYEYYIGHILKAPIDQLFSIGYMRQLGKVKEIGYKPMNKASKFKSICEPIDMITKMFEDYRKKGGLTIDQIKQYIPPLKDVFKAALEQPTE